MVVEDKVGIKVIGTVIIREETQVVILEDIEGKGTIK